MIISRYRNLNIEIETTHTTEYVQTLADVVHSVSNKADSGRA